MIINVTPYPTMLQRKIIQKMDEDPLHETSVMVKNARREHASAAHVQEKAKNYFMILSQASELDATILQLRGLPTWNPLAQVVILFTSEMLSEYQINKEVKEVLEKAFTYLLFNVNVMYQCVEDFNKMRVVSWFPYEGTNCVDRVQNIKIIDECVVFEGTDKIELHTIVKESKFPKTMHNCPLKVSSVINQPYVVSKNHTIVKGIEVLMMHVLAENLQMVPVFTIVNISKATEIITMDNVTGFYADLLTRFVTLIFCSDPCPFCFS